MKKLLLVCALFAFVFAFVGCEQEMKPKTKDPLESLTYEYLDHVKKGDYDAAYNMLSEDTRKYYPKKEFVEYAKTFILPKVDAVYVTKIEKHKLDAKIFTEFKPNSSWATYNTMESAKVNLDVIYKDGRWFIHMPERVATGMEEEAKLQARLDRVATWKPRLKLLNFKVENKIVDEGPMLVVHGEIENTSDKLCEMVMVMVNFYGPKGDKVYNIVVVPVYISAYEQKEGLKPNSKLEFVETISSEIPDTWTGKIDYEIYDAGDMPQKQ